MVFNQEYISDIRDRAKEFNAKKIILFGSALDNPENCNDIDLACDIPDLGLFLFASKLEEKLRIQIDIIPIDNSDPFMKIVNKYGKVIYES
jgi:predicted nucleotidyltransferase